MHVRRAMLSLLAASIAVHTCLLLIVHARFGAVDALAFRSLDGREYYHLGRNLLEHGSFSTAGEGEPLAPDTWRTPGYPLFLAAVMALAGSSPTAVIVAHQLLAVVNVILFFHLLVPRWGARRATWATTALLLEPYGLYYS
ncbi:MAG: hypothetical protein D6788_08990, partial [Planctomycetota bacterium]